MLHSCSLAAATLYTNNKFDCGKTGFHSLLVEGEGANLTCSGRGIDSQKQKNDIFGIVRIIFCKYY
jgi:hypothetical protein